MNANKILSRFESSVLTLVLVLSLASQGEAQTPTSITITAPTNETSVQPGQTLSVTASASGVSRLAIVGNGPIGGTSLQSGGDNPTFSLMLPDSIKPGRYLLTGVGTDSSGALVKSDSVSIIVPNIGVYALSIDPKSLFILAPGNQDSIGVQGLTSTGKTAMFAGNLSFSRAFS